MNLLNRHRKDRLQKLVSVLTDRFIRRPAEQLLRAQIPVSDGLRGTKIRIYEISYEPPLGSILFVTG